LFLFCSGLFSGLFLPGCVLRQAPPGDTPQPPVETRDAFTKMLLGKTPEEVIRVAGKPARTSEDSDVEYWHYRYRTRDPRSDSVDSDAQVVFHQGRVTAVNY
jgi:hypothetical protein